MTHCDKPPVRAGGFLLARPQAGSGAVAGALRVALQASYTAWHLGPAERPLLALWRLLWVCWCTGRSRIPVGP